MLSNKEKELLLKLLLEKAEKPLEVTASNTLVKPVKKFKRKVKHPIRMWTDEEKRQIIELSEMGFNDRVIADKFNARHHQIHMVIWNHKNRTTN